MKYLSLLSITVFFVSSCAHNRIQFGPRHEKDQSAIDKLEPLIVHSTQDTLDYEVENQILAQTKPELEGTSLVLSKINKAVISRYIEPVKRLEKTIGQLIDNQHQSTIIDTAERQKHKKANGNIAFGVVFLVLALCCFALTMYVLYVAIFDPWGFKFYEFLPWMLLPLALGITFLIFGVKFLKKGVHMKREVKYKELP